MSNVTPKNEIAWTADAKLPPLSKPKVDWDLKKLFYKSEKDPQLEKDVYETELAYKKFAKKYQNGNWTKDINTVLKALKDYVSLQSLSGARPMYYFSYRKELNAGDSVAERALNKLSDRLMKAGNEIIFFPLQLAKLPKTLQKQLLTSDKASEYRWFLESIFDDAKYQLSEPEEKIMNLKSLTARELWISGTEKIVSKKTIKWKGKDMPIHGALMQFEQLPYKERHLMWKKIKEVLEGVSEVAENELTALALDKKNSDELRGYKKPYSATTHGYDSNDKTLETLVSIIEDRGYALSRRFFALKKKVLKQDLTYIDRNEPITKEPRVSFETAVEICRDTFYGFNPEYGKFFDGMLKSGQIDVWPKAGKGGGAFCSSGTNQPTMVSLNHNDSLESLRTLAHEMGHAIHAMCSKRQPALYEGHSILTAETASTFFESLAMERLMAKTPPKERAAILNCILGDKIGTMIMCIARFKFELEMHETIRREGGMDAEAMSAGLAKHFADYTGKAIDTKPEHGLIVYSKPHYRMNFYQYSYSFGEIGSSIMRARYKEDKAYAEKVDSFLSQGESASVEAIFKTAGIDMSKSKTYHQGLDLLEAEINEFEKLLKSTNLAK